MECGILFQQDSISNLELIDPKRTGELIGATTKNLIGEEPVHRIVVDTGPGSYTGTRIGVAFAQGFARGLGLNWIGISAWEILNILKPSQSIPVIAVKSGEVLSYQPSNNVQILPLSKIEYPFGYPLLTPEKYGGVVGKEKLFPTISDWLATMIQLADQGKGTQDLPPYYDQYSGTTL